MKAWPLFTTIVLLLGGCLSRPEIAPAPAVARFLLESDAVRTSEIVLPVSGVVIRVLPQPVILEYDIVNAELAEVELGQCLLFELTPGAARDLFRLSAANPGRRLVLLLNDIPVGARVIDRPLDEGVIHVFCEVPDHELPALVSRIKRTAAEIRREAVKR